MATTAIGAAWVGYILRKRTPNKARPGAEAPDAAAAPAATAAPLVPDFARDTFVRDVAVDFGELSFHALRCIRA